MLITRSGINCPKGNNGIQYRLSKQLRQLELEAPEAINAPTGCAKASLLSCPHCVRATLASLDVPNEDESSGKEYSPVFVSTLRLSANRSVCRRAFGSHLVPRSHTLTWTTLARKGRLRGLPLTSSSSAPAQRNQSVDCPLA